MPGVISAVTRTSTGVPEVRAAVESEVVPPDNVTANCVACPNATRGREQNTANPKNILFIRPKRYVFIGSATLLIVAIRRRIFFK